MSDFTSRCSPTVRCLVYDTYRSYAPFATLSYAGTLSLVTVLYGCMTFFFSSRRRHTRFDCDWSSDVCSSDLSGLDGPSESVSAGRPAVWPTARLSLCEN